jgi:hypothetical protein
VGRSMHAAASAGRVRPRPERSFLIAAGRALTLLALATACRSRPAPQPPSPPAPTLTLPRQPIAVQTAFVLTIASSRWDWYGEGEIELDYPRGLRMLVYTGATTTTLTCQGDQGLITDAPSCYWQAPCEELFALWRPELVDWTLREFVMIVSGDAALPETDDVIRQEELPPLYWEGDPKRLRTWLRAGDDTYELVTDQDHVRQVIKRDRADVVVWDVWHGWNLARGRVSHGRLIPDDPPIEPRLGKSTIANGPGASFRWAKIEWGEGGYRRSTLSNAGYWQRLKGTPDFDLTPPEGYSQCPPASQATPPGGTP